MDEENGEATKSLAERGVVNHKVAKLRDDKHEGVDLADRRKSENPG